MRAEHSRIDLADVLELRLDSDENSEGSTGAALALRRRGKKEAAISVTDVNREGGRIRARLADLPIADGLWDVLWVDADGRSVPISTRDCGLDLTSRAAYLRYSRTRELRTVRDPQGRLRIHVATVVPYAEVGWVDVSPDAVTISGVLAYAPEHRDDAVSVVARQRGLDGVLTATAELEEDRFHCEIPLGPVVRAHELKRAHNEWDLWLQTSDSRTNLRLAAHADDIVSKKHKIVYPGVNLGGRGEDGGEPGVRVRPYYTVKDKLSLLATEQAGGSR